MAQATDAETTAAVAAPHPAARFAEATPDEPATSPAGQTALWKDHLAKIITDNQVGWVMFLVMILGTGAVLYLRNWGIVSREPLWTYGVASGACTGVAVFLKPWSVSLPLGRKLYTEMACQAIAAILFIYLTGWGPEMIVVFVLMGVMSITRHGSAAWKASLVINSSAICLAQVAVALRWAPSQLNEAGAQTVAFMSLVVFGMTVGMMKMVTEKVERSNSEHRRSEERFRSLVQYSSDTTVVLSPDGREILYASPATFDLLGVSPEEFHRRGLNSFIHYGDLGRISAVLGELFTTEAAQRIECRLVTGAGVVRHVEGVVSDMCDNEAVGGIVMNLHDITARKQVEESLSHDVLHDALTGLPNRRLLLDRLEVAMARKRRDGPGQTMTVVLYVDLDNFKEVNDRLGHASGDDLLVQVSGRMRACIRETDLLARFGGDEFIVLGDDYADSDAASDCARRLISCVEKPFNLSGKVVTVGMSVGMAVADATMTAEEVLDNADQAMYLAKKKQMRLTPEREGHPTMS